MSKEEITNDNSNTETLERQEQAPVDVERKETSQEFANKILNKIKEYMSSFTSKKEVMEKIESTVSFNDPITKEQIKSEINLDSQIDEIDTEVAKVQTEASTNINATISNFSKAYHHPEYRDKIAKEIKEARNSGNGAEAVRSGFYDKTVSEKENFESQEKERSVAEIMKEKDLVIIHAIPIRTIDRKSTPENNPILKTGGHQDFRTSVELLSGLSPTISTSIPSSEKNNNGLYYPGGVILGEGKILSAHYDDSGSVAHGLYKRIPKLGGGAIQPEINIDKVVKEGRDYNELTVEKPQIAGFFYDLTEEEQELPLEDPKKEEYLNNMRRYNKVEPSQEDIDRIDESWQRHRIDWQRDQKQKKMTQGYELNQIKKYSEEFNVPLYIFKKEQDELKKYRIKFLTRPIEEENNNIKKSDYILEEVTAKDIYESKRDISNEERKKMIEDVKNKGILSDSAEKEVSKKFQNL